MIISLLCRKLKRRELLAPVPMRRMKGEKQMSNCEIIERLEKADRASSTAIIDSNGTISTYEEIMKKSRRLASFISERAKHSRSLSGGGAIAAFCDNSSSYVITILACWRLNCPSHSAAEMEHMIADSHADVVVGNIGRERLPDMDNKPIFISTTEGVDFSCGNRGARRQNELHPGEHRQESLIIYTSGTTGKPKGVVHTHSSLESNIRDLVSAWKYDKEDYILHFLPLYHMHGILNKLLCILWVGGTVEFLSSAKITVLWKRLCNPPSSPQRNPTLFMAVPTVYAKLIEYFNTEASKAERNYFNNVFQAMRLNVSGSAALPEPVMREWTKISGHLLLERYGMTEAGMILGNPYEGERLVGYVGNPFNSIKCRLVGDNDEVLTEANIPGELQVKGPTLFKKYLNLPNATIESFTTDEWFKTGDIADRNEAGQYRILGRNSTDIIKSNGYKISALEIERVLLEHPWVLEIAVVGLPDKIAGEVVTAIVALRHMNKSAPDSPMDIWSSWSEIRPPGAAANFFRENIRLFLSDKLASYKQPKSYYFVDHLKRNHLGKVNKKELVKYYDT